MIKKWHSGPSTTVTAANQLSNSVFKGKHVDADYETSVEHTVREIIQNSLDAKPNEKILSDPVRIAIDIDQLTHGMFPERNSLSHRLVEIDNYYKTKDSAQKTNVANLVKKVRNTIDHAHPVLICRFSDFETTGIDCVEPTEGGDRSKFVEFAMTIGGSEKDPSLSGQNGFGRLAPFASSACRTVIYSTHFDQNHSVGTIGMAMLAGTKGADKKGVDANSYFGEYNDEDLLFPVNELIPPFAHPDRHNRPGLDVSVIDIDAINYNDVVVPAILINFWLAIHDSYLQLEFNSYKFSAETLESIFNKELGKAKIRGSDLYQYLLAQYKLFLIYKDTEKFEVSEFASKKGSDLYLDKVNIWGKRITADEAREIDTGLYAFNERGMLIGKIPSLQLKTQTFLGIVRPSGSAASYVLKISEDPSHTSYSVDYLTQRMAERGDSGNPKKLLRDFKSTVAKAIRDRFASSSDKSFSIDLKNFYEPLDIVPNNGNERSEPDITPLQDANIDEVTLRKLKTKKDLTGGGGTGNKRKTKTQKRRKSTVKVGPLPPEGGFQIKVARCFLGEGEESYWAKNLEGNVTGISLLVIDDGGHWKPIEIERAIVNGIEMGSINGKIILKSEAIDEIEAFPRGLDPKLFPRAVKLQLEMESEQHE